MKYIKSVLSVIIISSGLIVQAQTDFRPGYVIDFSGDTLFGDIDYRGDLLMGTACKLKMPNGETIEYSPYDIAGFRFIDSKYFVSKEISGKRAFLEYLINGEVSIYYLRDDSGDHYYIDKEGLGISELPYEEGTKEVNLQKTIYETSDQEKVIYESTIHIGYLKYYMQDDPEIFSKIDNLNKPNHTNLIKLAKDYHNAVCFDEQCVIYEKKKPLFKLAAEPFLGYKYLKSIYESYNISAGGNIYISLPRTNEKLSFKTGIEFIGTPESNIINSIVEVPLQVQYMYPAYKIKPKFSFGFNFINEFADNHTNSSHSICLNGGFNYPIYKKTKISINLSTEIYPFLYSIMEETGFTIFSNSISIGLYFE